MSLGAALCKDDFDIYNLYGQQIETLAFCFYKVEIQYKENQLLTATRYCGIVFL